MSMTNSTNRVEIITSVQRRRRWTAPEKVRMVEETFELGMTEAWWLVGMASPQTSCSPGVGWLRKAA